MTVAALTVELYHAQPQQPLMHTERSGDLLIRPPKNRSFETAVKSETRGVETTILKDLKIFVFRWKERFSVERNISLLRPNVLREACGPRLAALGTYTSSAWPVHYHPQRTQSPRLLRPENARRKSVQIPSEPCDPTSCFQGLQNTTKRATHAI